MTLSQMALSQVTIYPLNKLPLNVEKRAHLAITNRQYQFYLGKEIIAYAEHQNGLGLTLSCDLKWNLHIDKVCAKAMKMSHMIKRNISELSSAAKLRLYKSMIVPILIYRSPCYGTNVLTELEHVQKRVVNWVLFGTNGTKTSLDHSLSYRFPCINRSIISSYSRNSSVVDTIQAN